MMIISPEALHPGPVVQKKKGKLGGGPLPPGEQAKKGGVTKAKEVNDPLTKLYTWFAEHGRKLDGAPPEMRNAARAYIRERIGKLSTLRDASSAQSQRTGRIRAQLRWLNRWAKQLKGDA